MIHYAFQSAKAHPRFAIVLAVVAIAVWVGAMILFPDNFLGILAVPPSLLAVVELVQRLLQRARRQGKPASGG